MGGGTPRAAHQARLAAPTHFRHSCAPTRHSCAPNRHSCAGRNQATSQFGARRSPTPPAVHAASPPNKPKKTTLNTSRHPAQPVPPSSPIHPSPLLGGRLGGGWNAASRAPSPARSADPLPSFLRSYSSFLRPLPSFLRRQEPGDLPSLARGAPPLRRPPTSHHPRTNPNKPEQIRTPPNAPTR